MAGIIKVTIVDSPEKMRSQNMGYSIIIPQVRNQPTIKKVERADKNTKNKYILRHLITNLCALPYWLKH